MGQQLLKLKCCQGPVCLTRWGCGAHGEGSPHPHLGDVGALLPPNRHNAKSEVAPWSTECDQEQRVEERQAGPVEGGLGCVSGGQRC